MLAPSFRKESVAGFVVGAGAMDALTTLDHERLQTPNGTLEQRTTDDGEGIVAHLALAGVSLLAKSLDVAHDRLLVSRLTLGTLIESPSG